MFDVTRWDDAENGTMYEHSFGDWVKYTDYITLDEQLADAKLEIAVLQDACERFQKIVSGEDNELVESTEAILSLVDESQGLYGFHLNGNPAPWSEFGAEISRLRAAIEAHRENNQ